MDFDNSWNALLRPGDATEFFDVHHQTHLQVGASSYSRINAWWLAEISRLVYKKQDDEAGKAALRETRNNYLNEFNLQEVEFNEEANTQCAIVTPLSRADERFVVTAFRGSDSLRDWLYNLTAVPVRWSGAGLVHKGFSDALNAVWGKIDACLKGFDCPAFYTGHSLGAALATLAASRRPPRALYTFGSPRVGNSDFVDTLAGTSVFRIVHNRDVVASVPPSFLGFCHVGERHHIKGNNHETVGGRLDRLKGPPGFMADHAPVNYVARLERENQGG